MRDIRLQMEQDSSHRATVDFSGRVNRDQRDLALSFSAEVQGGDYPHSLKADISQLNWQLRGAELPLKGLAARPACRPAGLRMRKAQL